MTWRKNSLVFSALFGSLAAMPATAAGMDAPGRVGEVIAGEFAFQSGLYREAARHYLQAALGSRDRAVVERAARMAVLAGDDDALAAVLSRWHELQPGSPRRAGLGLRLALRQSRSPDALTEARQLLELGREGLQELRSSLEGARGAGAVAARGLVRDLAVEPDALPRSLDAWLGLAALARDWQEKDAADRLLERMPAVFPEEPLASLALASWRREQGDAGAAIGVLARLQPGQVPREEQRRQVAAEWLNLGKHGEAERWLASVAQDAASYRQRIALLSEGGSAGAIEALERQVGRDRGLEPGNRQVLLGLVAELGSDWQRAERRYRAVRNDPGRLEARLRLAFVLQKQGRRDDALVVLRALQADRGMKQDARRDAYVLEAQLLRPLPGQADLSAYSRGLLAFPDDSQLLYARGLRQVEYGQVDAGLADLRRILEAEPDNAAALNAYGYSLAERLQRYDEALPYVERALRLQPDSAAYLDSLGYIRLRQGRHDLALPLLERAWSLQPDPEIAAHLGEVLWLSGRREEAAAVWARGLALDPGNQQILSVRESLQP